MLNIWYNVTDLAFIGCDHTPVIPDLIHLNNMLMMRYLFFWLQHVNSKIWQYAASAATSIAALLLNPANPDEDGSPGYTGHHHLLCLPGTIELRVTGKRFALHIISRWVRVFWKGLSVGRSVTMFHFRHQRNAVNCQAINQVGKHSENWVDRESMSFRSSHTIVNYMSGVTQVLRANRLWVLENCTHYI